MIVPRTHWGSRALGGRPIDGPVSEVIVHHAYRPDVPPTVSSSYEREVLRNIEQYHIDQFYGGDVEAGGGTGYQFLVFASARAYEGRGLFRTGAHTKGRNSSTLSICLVLDGDTRTPPDGVWDACRYIIDRAIAAGALAETYKVSGHRDYADKSCPGDLVYPHIQRLGPHHPEDDMPLTDDDVKRIAQAVFDRLQPSKGKSLGDELDLIRTDIRRIGDALDVDVQS